VALAVLIGVIVKLVIDLVVVSMVRGVVLAQRRGSRNGNLKHWQPPDVDPHLS
jgi:hypothetical protein